MRLKPDIWQAESINWLLDGEACADTGSRSGPNAPDRKTAGRVTASFAHVVKEGELRLHPQIGGLVEREMLEKMGGSRGPVAGAS